MIRLILLALLIALPTAVSAQTAVVKSGDHAGFSRLVLGFDAGADWEFGKVEGGYEFRAGRATVSYDLATVFELIPKTRIENVIDRGGGRLFLKVACACHADAFDLRTGQVVLDIKDGPPPRAASVFERPLEPLGRQPESGAPPLLRQAVGDLDRGGLPLLPARPAREQADSGASADDTAPAVAGGAQQPPAPPPAPDTTEMQAALLEQIARAAAQGLLEADLGDLDRAAEAVSNVGARAAGAPVAPAEPVPEPEPQERTRLTVATAVDRAAAGPGPTAGTGREGDACLPPELFEIAGWGDPDMPIGHDLGGYRGQMLSEMQTADGDGTTALARHYLFMSFGAEAKALIGRNADRIERPDVLTIMAEVMDDGVASDAGLLAGQTGCPGATALWAVLSQPRLDPAAPINREAVTLAFAALPAHLRHHLGAGLTTAFLGIGDAETAETISRATARARNEPDSHAAELAVRLDLERGDPEARNARLDEIIARGEAGLPDALLQRADAAWTAGLPLPPDKVSLLESLAFERRGSAEARAFEAAAVRAHALASDFEAAFARLTALDAEAKGGTDELLSDALLLLSDRGSDATLLRFALPRLDAIAALAPENRRRFAERFLELGLAEPARDVLAGEGAPPLPEDRLLFARAALLDNRPDIAIGYLAGLQGDMAERLRGEALERATDFAGAVRAYQRLGDDEAARAAAWRGGLWSTLADMGEGAAQDVARRMAPRDPPDPNPATPLAQARALIDASRSDREAIAAALSSLPPPLPATTP